MAKFANKTFFKFLIGFLVIISISFLIIMGTNYLAAIDAEKATAQVGEEGECVGAEC